MADWRRWEFRLKETVEVDNYCLEHGCPFSVVFLPIPDGSDRNHQIALIPWLKQLAQFGEHLILSPVSDPDGFMFRYHG